MIPTQEGRRRPSAGTSALAPEGSRLRLLCAEAPGFRARAGGAGPVRGGRGAHASEQRGPWGGVTHPGGLWVVQTVSPDAERG